MADLCFWNKLPLSSSIPKITYSSLVWRNFMILYLNLVEYLSIVHLKAGFWFCHWCCSSLLWKYQLYTRFWTFQFPQKFILTCKWMKYKNKGLNSHKLQPVEFIIALSSICVANLADCVSALLSLIIRLFVCVLSNQWTDALRHLVNRL